MKISELLEQTIGTIGSTTGNTTLINPVSNKPSDKPISSTTPKPDPKNQQLDNLLKQNQINVKSTDDFLRAYTAVQQNQPIDKLPPEQRKALGDYTKASLAKPGLANQMSMLLKTIPAPDNKVGQNVTK
ncbi:MAG: hypothetical protein EBX47_06540 [Synechococcaceae bacterium WB8_1B_057]|nr:hypothetical protein [Synechococcaceae bacterium WB6_1A_059]NDG79072.1 hypothetical protein [Synechococcaceae bacterium WB8_1B_057]